MPSPPAATGSALGDGDLLARLVAFDTTSRLSNLPLADFLADYLDLPAVSAVFDRSADGAKANLLLRVGPQLDGGGRRPGLVLSGHMDVVPAEEDGWESEPFRLADRGDRWVARGAADMKGFLAVAANLAREAATRHPGSGLAAPLVLLLTYDEEVGTLGARHLVDGWDAVEAQIGTLPRAAVIGEPTELAVVRLHKGHLKMRFDLAGRAAHSGYPHLGTNAIEAAGRVVVALSRLRRELEGERVASSALFPQVPYAALNVGTIAGGSAINVVPDRCAVEAGVRVLPGMDAAALADRMRATAGAAAGAEEPRAPVVTTVVSASPPLETPAAAPIHAHLRAALGQADDAGAAFATDAGWLQCLGLDCVLYGPGSIEVAHKPNEFVPKSDLAAARQTLAGLIDHFCVRAEAA